MASVDLRKPMEAVRELRRCVRESGFKALRVVPWLWGWPPDDRRYYPLYRVRRARHPVLYPGRPHRTAADL
jgi:predicted TIM-barrel fold metal-dependent hydrolase